MFEFFGGSFLYSLTKDVWNLLRGRKRRLTTAEIIQARQKWKSEFEEQFSIMRSKKLGIDVIIRDMKRLDSYPDADEKRKGISPWFKVGLMGTYHRGILAGLQWVDLVQDAETGNLRCADYAESERDGITAILIGYIPHEYIEAVDWKGDEYYNLPIIYCYFDTKNREPYERLAYCEKKELNGFPFYTEVASYVSPPKRRKRHARFHRSRREN